MAWPFLTAPAPTYDTGLVAVPTTLTQLTVGSPWLLEIDFANPTAALITAKVVNAAGDEIIPTVEVPANGDFQRMYSFKQAVGLKWQASASGLKGQIWGYI